MSERAHTPRKMAMRTLLHAGRYIQAQYNTAMSVSERIALSWAATIIANQYNEVLHEQL